MYKSYFPPLNANSDSRIGFYAKFYVRTVKNLHAAAPKSRDTKK
jgi:hypothetical protein